MKKTTLMFSLIASFLLLQASAQNTPAGFKKGSVTLIDGSSRAGFIKENLRAGSLAWTSSDGHDKKKYTSSDLSHFTLDSDTYTVIQNDFFKVIQDGQLCFLQKASDVSGQLRYSGSEAIILTGTDGKPGDYFLFSKRTASLQQVSAKNFETVTHSVFSGNQAALDKAGAAKADIPDLKMAVEIYNAGK